MCIRDRDGLEVAALSMSGSDAGADERLDTVCGCVAEERVIRRLCLIPDVYKRQLL